ncbi:MAG: DUF1156 domain-containing protein [Acidobacteriota bacterium]
MPENKTPNKKLIEVALPLDAINAASAREKSIRHGHPSTLHLWWARRPLAAARAVIFAQMVDDPSSHPDLFPTEEDQERERQRLFALIEELVKWENTTNEKVLGAAREEIWKSWRRTCAENADHPRADELFDPEKLPAFHDPFAGGGALPLEAQRLGLEAHASDLNPVAVLINKAMIEIPPKFAGQPPVNPEARAAATLATRKWKGAEGLAEDVRYYGKWMRDEAEKRIGHLYPKVEITPEMVAERPDLRPYEGRKLTVIAWLWARTVRSPNPAFSDIEVPLVSNFMLATKKGKEAYVEPLVQQGGYRFVVKAGQPQDPAAVRKGTKRSGANFICLMSGTPVTGDHIRVEAGSGRLGQRMMSVVLEGDRQRVYLSPTNAMEQIALSAKPAWRPEISFFEKALGFRIGNYGMSKWSDVFSSRQTTALATFCDLIPKVFQRAVEDAEASGNVLKVAPDDWGDAICVYLGLGIGRSADFWSSISTWSPQPKNELVSHAFTKQVVPMTWDFAEANPFSSSGGNFNKNISYVAKAVGRLGRGKQGQSIQSDARSQRLSDSKIVSTDPPYFDNVGYADLSDYFYVWLRRALKWRHAKLLATLEVPKAEELVATPGRHGGKEEAEKFFLEGMTDAMTGLTQYAHAAFPTTVYYAFRQSETASDGGTTSTGWETFLAALISAGMRLLGTWPLHTERKARSRSIGSNALASSIVLVCRRREGIARSTSRREFASALKVELPKAVLLLQRGNIAPVDLAQSAIGPGMAVFTRYERVLDAAGNPLSVREALALINETLDEILAEQDGDFDGDSRWALAWFEQVGFEEGEYGVAETLSKAKNTSVEGLAKAGILTSNRGKVRLLRPEELPADWDPATDSRLTAWEIVHHLVRVLEIGGERAAGELVSKLGSDAETARELCYRLYTLCERKKRAAEALAYNSLVQSWPEISRLAREKKPAAQLQLL